MNFEKTFGIKIKRLSRLAKAVGSDYNDSREKDTEVLLCKHMND